MNEVLVTLAEIAAARGRKAGAVRAECAELGLFVREDWAGRPAITVDEARALVSGSARRAREDQRARAGVKAACARWEKDREAAARAGADAAQEKAKRAAPRAFLPGAFVRQGEATPAQVHAARREGFLHAGAQFERRHPRPGPYAALAFVDASQEGSKVAAAAGALRGPAKPKPAPGGEVA